MNGLPQTWQESLQYGSAAAITQFSSFLPRLLAGLLILILGIFAAKVAKKLMIKTLEAFRVAKIVEKTPLELFFSEDGIGPKVEEIIAGLFYWAVVFLVIYTTTSVLGLTPLTMVMDRILSYIPHMLSAFLIFFFGVLMAGVVESVVKGSLRKFDLATVRLTAKLASYIVVIIASLAAVVELGIASQFLTILFGGLVLSFSLGLGLAIGLGGQDTVRAVLADWYKRSKSK